MEFWRENKGKSPLYSKFATVSGRNCSHSHHDRHQVPHYPLYYGDQQEQSRESSYWTVPGSRSGGAPHEYTQWTDRDLAAATSSHFPFILERHAQQHQDQGDHQPQEARDREWTAAQSAREYERGLLREEWQRRWEPCGPVRYNTEVSAKRSDSSYRELEAWAARYSHSLPRRRRIEAEMRGASQESNRAPGRESRSGTDPRLEALQQVRQSANIRESGLWDRGGRQQAPNYYTLQTPASDTSNMLDMKEKIGYQQRMFSQPPGYIAPPPYDSPHKGSPVLNQCDVSWEQEGKRQTYSSQPKLRKQDVCVDLQEKKQFIKQAGMLKSFPELEGLKYKQKETGALQARSHFSAQETHMQHEGMSYLQQPQVLQAVENTKINEESYSKVIEGRKFRLNKKTGGLTIFCLVSRIAGPTETPSLPLCSLQTNNENTELRSVSKGLWDNSGYNQTHKLADEVDFRATTPTEQSNTSDATNVKREAPTCVESEMLEDTIAKTDLFPAEAQTNSVDSAFGRQVAQSVPVKYPLWREPIFSSRTETERSSTCYKADSEDGESDVLLNQGGSGKVHPIDVEVRKLDIKKTPQSEDSNNPLLIDATCICVQMEQIPSPKKEHVLYSHTQHSPLQSTTSPECFESNSQMDKDDLNTEPKPFLINDMLKNEFDSDPMEKKAPEEESIISSLGMSFSSVFEKETLEERAERILGIPLLDCIIMQQPEDASSLLGFSVENQEVKPSTIKDTDIDEQIPDDQREEEPNQFKAVKTEVDVCSQENDVANDQAEIEDGRGCAEPQDQVSNTSQVNNIDSQLKSDIKPLSAIEMIENPLKPVTTEQEEKDTSPHYPSQCLWPFNDLSNSSLCSPFPDFEAPSPDLPLMLSSSDPTHLLHISNSEIEEGPDPELIALNSAESHAPCSENSSLPQNPSSLSPASTDFPPTPSPLDFINQTAESVSDIEVQDEEGETSQLINEISDTFEDGKRNNRRDSVTTTS
ncbi:Serine/threonine-protein kinase Nek1 [Dissostichus eleginoides]|uniref:Serine/threonine-protein kinase Nek1 n=1 Tax=Dissostichus eleginoides TaxID=100907 RepID=A0AAD9CEY6_DISEL|nr:Serine/threonine-protein kinase Nek1 [Dissostichus eleginoides]